MHSPIVVPNARKDAEAVVADIEIALLEMLEAAPRFVCVVARQMNFPVLADDLPRFFHEDCGIVAFRHAFFLHSLRIAETEAQIEALRLVEQRLRGGAGHLGLEEEVDLGLIGKEPARKERR